MKKSACLELPPPTERNCQLYHGKESEEHYVCQCSVCYEIRGGDYFGPLWEVMECEH